MSEKMEAAKTADEAKAAVFGSEVQEKEPGV